MIPTKYDKFHYFKHSLRKGMINMIKKTLDEKAFQLLKEKMDQGLFPQWVLTDPDIYELEQE